MIFLHLFWNENKTLHKRVLDLAWPVMIANLCIPLAGVVDTAVVGHLPNPAFIGAVALGALVFSTMYFLFGFLRMGTTGLIAQSLGVEDYDEIAATYVRSLCVGVALGLLLIILQRPFGTLIFWYFEGTPQVEGHAQVYYEIRIWGACFALINLVNLGILFGLQKMRTALYLQLLLNGMNIVLDLVFVIGFKWTVAGVAFATLISECLTAIAGIWICYRLLGRNRISKIKHQLYQKKKLMRLAQINTNIFIRSLCLEVVFVYFMWVSTQLGTIVLAANAILLHLIHFLAYGLDGFAHAAEALAGNAYGRKHRKRLHEVVVVTAFWSVILAIGFCIFYLLVGPFIVSAITSIESVRSTTLIYLPWLIAAPLLCVWPFWFDGVYIGMTRTAEMRNCMLIAMVAYCAAVFLVLDHLENHGLWLALLVFMGVRGLMLGIWYPGIEKELDNQNRVLQKQ